MKRLWLNASQEKFLAFLLLAASSGRRKVKTTNGILRFSFISLALKVAQIQFNSKSPSALFKFDFLSFFGFTFRNFSSAEFLVAPIINQAEDKNVFKNLFGLRSGKS